MPPSHAPSYLLRRALRGCAAWCLFLVALCIPLPAKGESIRSGAFELRYDGPEANLLRDSAVILEEAVQAWGPYLPVGDKPIRVFIAQNEEEFSTATGRMSGMRVAGLARPEEGLVFVKAPYLIGHASDYDGTLRHELCHVLVHRLNGGGDVPRWLDEGLAMTMAREYQMTAPFTVAMLYLQQRLLTLYELDRMFQAPGTETEFIDAYAQAMSMTRYMRDHLGEDVFWRVIRACRDRSFVEAMEQEAGMTPLDFWQDYRRSLWFVSLLGLFSTGAVWGLGGVLLVLAYIRRKRKDAVIYSRWAREERGNVRGRLRSWGDMQDEEWCEEEDEDDVPWHESGRR